MDNYMGHDTDGQARAWAAEWKAALRDDGWAEEQTYPGSKTQGECYTYHRDEWVASVYDYQSPHNDKWHVSITVWGPGQIQIGRPEHYSWTEFQRLLNVCQYCKREVSKTVRLGFAGRACPECRKALASKVEFPGWTR